MINMNYVFHPSSCGYFCLKHILKRVKVRDKRYMSLDAIFDVLKSNNYSCITCKVSKIKEVFSECVSLVRVKERYYHYVIIKKVDKAYVYLYDPLFLFVRKIKISEFSKKWSHICLFYKKIK